MMVSKLNSCSKCFSFTFRICREYVGDDHTPNAQDRTGLARDMLAVIIDRFVAKLTTYVILLLVHFVGIPTVVHHASFHGQSNAIAVLYCVYTQIPG